MKLEKLKSLIIAPWEISRETLDDSSVTLRITLRKTDENSSYGLWINWNRFGGEKIDANLNKIEKEILKDNGFNLSSLKDLTETSLTKMLSILLEAKTNNSFIKIIPILKEAGIDVKINGQGGNPQIKKEDIDKVIKILQKIS